MTGDVENSPSERLADTEVATSLCGSVWWVSPSFETVVGGRQQPVYSYAPSLRVYVGSLTSPHLIGRIQNDLQHNEWNYCNYQAI